MRCIEWLGLSSLSLSLSLSLSFSVSFSLCYPCTLAVILVYSSGSSLHLLNQEQIESVEKWHKEKKREV